MRPLRRKLYECSIQPFPPAQMFNRTFLMPPGKPLLPNPRQAGPPGIACLPGLVAGNLGSTNVATTTYLAFRVGSLLVPFLRNGK